MEEQGGGGNKSRKGWCMDEGSTIDHSVTH